MNKNRLEAFSDGVIAIIITIMVLELKVPHGHDLDALRPILPVFSSYVLSFVLIGIYWNNHHHLLHVAKRVDARVMWANLHLLFWLSVIPFGTAWLGESHGAPLPTALYGAMLVMAAAAYTLLQHFILAQHPADSRIVRVFGADWKGKASLACYLTAIPLAFVYAPVADALFVVVALIWLVPDRRVERATASAGEHDP
jgi:uncharacterized membrane protein